MKKILFAFFIMFVLFLSACEPTTNNDDDGNDKGIVDDDNDENDDKDDDDEDPYVPFVGIDASLILGMDEAFVSVYEGELLRYYFYIEDEVTVSVSLETDFDSTVVIKHYESEVVIYDGDDSVFDDDLYTVLTLEEGEYVVEIDSYEGEGAISLLVEEGVSLPTLVELIALGDIPIGEEVLGFYVDITEAGVYQISSNSALDLEGVLMSTSGEFLTYNDDVSFDDSDFALMMYLDVGTYILGVRTFDELEEGVFDLVMEQQSFTPSTDLLEGTYVSDVLLAGERNRVNITVPSDGYVTLYSETVFDSVGYLYDMDGLLLAEDDDGHTGSDFYLQLYLEAGNYVLEVASYEDYECGYYEVYYTFDEDFVYDFDTITMNTYVIDSLGTDEIDGFELVITEGMSVDIFTVGNYDLYVEVYTATNIYVASDDDSGDDGNGFLDDLYLDPGIYYIYVSEFNYVPVDYYELHVYEGDDTTPSEHSYSLDLNTSVENTLEAGVSHVYEFTVPSYGSVTAYLVSSFDSVGYIYNDLGEYVVSNDDASYDSIDFKIDAVHLEAGVYYLYVEGYDETDIGAYTLHLVYEELSNETGEISPNTVESGSLGNNDVDTIRFTLTRGGYIRAYLDSGFDSVGSLVDLDGTVLLSGDDFGTDTDFVLEGMYLEPGVYDINIAGYTTGEYGAYDLYLEVVFGSTEEASELSFSSDVEGTLEEDGYHWYSIEVTEAGYLYTYLDSVFDSYGYVINDSGEYVAQDDDTYGNGDFEISWYLEVGTYYIVVCGYTALDVGDYTLHVSFSLPVE